MEQTKPTRYTMKIFVKDEGDVQERHATCPIDKNVLLASDVCWKCKYNLRKSRDSSLPPFTIECKKNPKRIKNKK